MWVSFKDHEIGFSQKTLNVQQYYSSIFYTEKSYLLEGFY